MRDIFSPAMKHVTKVIPHPSAIRAVLIKRRAFAFAIVAAFLVITLTGLLIARGVLGAHQQKNEAVTSSNSAASTATVTTANDETQALTEGDNMNANSEGPGSSSSKSKTSVTVNNQQIGVPENGSVTKTIKSGDGTTTVNVSNTSTGNDKSNSTTLNVNASTLNSTSGSSVHVEHSSQ